MANLKTKNNWWIVIVAFIIGLLIGSFLLANLNLFGKEVSMSPKSCFASYLSLFNSCVDDYKIEPAGFGGSSYVSENYLQICANSAWSGLSGKCKRQLSSIKPTPLPSGGAGSTNTQSLSTG